MELIGAGSAGTVIGIDGSNKAFKVFLENGKDLKAALIEIGTELLNGEWFSASLFKKYLSLELVILHVRGMGRLPALRMQRGIPLPTYLRDRQGEYRPDDDAYTIGMILDIITDLQKCNRFYLDFKLANIVVVDGTLFLCDVGGAVHGTSIGHINDAAWMEHMGERKVPFYEGLPYYFSPHVSTKDAEKGLVLFSWGICEHPMLFAVFDAVNPKCDALNRDGLLFRFKGNKICNHQFLLNTMFKLREPLAYKDWGAKYQFVIQYMFCVVVDASNKSAQDIADLLPGLATDYGLVAHYNTRPRRLP